MSEISGPNFSVNQMNFKSIKAPSEAPIEPLDSDTSQGQEREIITPRADELGALTTFKTVDGVNNDLKALLDNPNIANNSDKMFEAAYKAAIDSGVENPYEVAASFSTTAI